MCLFFKQYLNGHLNGHYSSLASNHTSILYLYCSYSDYYYYSYYCFYYYSCYFYCSYYYFFYSYFFYSVIFCTTTFLIFAFIFAILLTISIIPFLSNLFSCGYYYNSCYCYSCLLLFLLFFRLFFSLLFLALLLLLLFLLLLLLLFQLLFLLLMPPSFNLSDFLEAMRILTFISKWTFFIVHNVSTRFRSIK